MADLEHLKESTAVDNLPVLSEVINPFYGMHQNLAGIREQEARRGRFHEDVEEAYKRHAPESLHRYKWAGSEYVLLAHFNYIVLPNGVLAGTYKSLETQGQLSAGPCVIVSDSPVVGHEYPVVVAQNGQEFVVPLCTGMVFDVYGCGAERFFVGDGFLGSCNVEGVGRKPFSTDEVLTAKWASCAARDSRAQMRRWEQAEKSLPVPPPNPGVAWTPVLAG